MPVDPNTPDPLMPWADDLDAYFAAAYEESTHRTAKGDPITVGDVLVEWEREAVEDKDWFGALRSRAARYLFVNEGRDLNPHRRLKDQLGPDRVIDGLGF